MRRALWPALLAALFLPAVASAEESAPFLGIPRPLWLTINLIGFLIVLVWFVGRPLGQFLQARRDEIHGELEAAREKLAEAERLRQQVVERVEQVEREMQEMVEQAEAAGAREAERIRALAEEEAARFLEKIGAEIGRRTAETRQQLAQDTATLAAQLAKELLARETTDADRARILKRSLEALASSSEGRR